VIGEALDAMKATPYGTALALALAGMVGLYGGTQYIKAIVADEAPYVKERGVILDGMERVRAMESDVRAIRERLARIEAKIDKL